MFTRREIRSHLHAPKTITGIAFMPPSKSRALPPPFRLKSKRVQHTNFLNAGGDYRVLFLWRDGRTRDRKAYYCYLYLKCAHGNMPLARIDYHPSHKDLHMLVNCEDERNLVNRNLPGCRQLSLRSVGSLDPALETDRSRLIKISMTLFNIEYSAPMGRLL
jgi:hypothetical protein